MLLVGLWLWSGWGTAGHWSNRWSAGVAAGEVWVAWWPLPDDPLGSYWLASVPKTIPEWGWWVHSDVRGLFTARSVPLWIPIVLVACATLAAWRLDSLARRRANPGVCPKCNYDRTGLAPTAVCPECGTKPSP